MIYLVFLIDKSLAVLTLQVIYVLCCADSDQCRLLLFICWLFGIMEICQRFYVLYTCNFCVMVVLCSSWKNWNLICVVNVCLYVGHYYTCVMVLTKFLKLVYDYPHRYSWHANYSIVFSFADIMFSKSVQICTSSIRHFILNYYIFCFPMWGSGVGYVIIYF